VLIDAVTESSVELRTRLLADGYWSDPEPWHTISGERALTLPPVAGRTWKLGLRSDAAIEVCAARETALNRGSVG
jgi:hypothetical protein